LPMKFDDFPGDHLGCGIRAVRQVQLAQGALEGRNHDGDLVWPERGFLQEASDRHDTPEVDYGKVKTIYIGWACLFGT
jgi:hypothetical protein